MTSSNLTSVFVCPCGGVHVSRLCSLHAVCCLTDAETHPPVASPPKRQTRRQEQRKNRTPTGSRKQSRSRSRSPHSPPQIKRRAHGHDLGPLYDSARGNRGQLGRRNSRGSRYQHVGQRVPQRERFPANSLHRLLPAEWGQGKRTRAINRYKKDLRQAEEELQQLLSLIHI